MFLVFVAIILILEIGLSMYFSLRDVTKYGVLLVFILGFACFPLNNKLVDWIYSLINPKIEREIKNAKNSKRGFEGEDSVNSWLEEIVDKEDIMKNVTLPDRNFDIDFLLVGSKGIVAIEVKNLTDPVRFEDDECFYEKDRRKISLSPEEDPRFKFKKYIYFLRKYLEDNDFGFVRIKKAIIFTNGKVSWDGNTGVYIIKDKEKLASYINNLEIDSALTPDICEKIKTLLRK